MGARGAARSRRRVGAVIAVALGLGLLGTSASQARPSPVGSTGPSHLRYVAMGDSYTSGPLILPHDQTWVPQDCGQSLFNYPHLAAALLHTTEFVDVSCGSATIDDLFRPQDGLPVGGVNAPQLDAVHADTDVVTLGMGGNDVGFVGLALDCVRLLGPPTEQPCTPRTAGTKDDPVTRKVATVGPELGRALEAIHAKAPRAHVFVVGYPTSLPDSAVGCWPYLPILQADLPWLVAKFKEMNAMLEREAERHDATYIDIYTPSIGHDTCALPGQAWVNGLVLVPPSFPAHPNQLGEAHAGRIVSAAIQAHLG